MALMVILAAGLPFASRADAAAWTQSGYLYRYLVFAHQASALEASEVLDIFTPYREDYA